MKLSAALMRLASVRVLDAALAKERKQRDECDRVIALLEAERARR